MNILFIPGNSQSVDSFSEQIGSSLFDKHQLTVFDLEGEVNALENPGPISFFSDLKERLLELHRFKKFDCVVGHSWGGHLIAESVAQMEGVKGIVTFGAPFIAKPPRMEDSFLPNPAVPLFFTKNLNDEQLVQLAKACLYNKDWVQHIFNGMKKSSGIIRELTPAAISTGSYVDEVEQVAKLSIPICIVHGEKDEMVNADYYGTMDIPTLWGGEVFRISGSGHFPQLENAEEFNNLLARFFEDLC
ncbi:alpha/beta fold hydrolase [Plebeiibacterium marinum]|uniref:Alpha/beta hydrolase n=1 Tax=Plebeiibacterium marinum TaxID=2992111 RepID=A0AAE3MEH1_9BACT|nr:alpha/beta hydrolase [Plebeiobacterium marinum]MCW3806276.1 alpha/beta hydrolase [Plebeiobacterium marinum]